MNMAVMQAATYPGSARSTATLAEVPDGSTTLAEVPDGSATLAEVPDDSATLAEVSDDSNSLPGVQMHTAEEACTHVGLRSLVDLPALPYPRITKAMATQLKICRD
jgi:hypothetical protein